MVKLNCYYLSGIFVHSPTIFSSLGHCRTACWRRTFKLDLVRNPSSTKWSLSIRIVNSLRFCNELASNKPDIQVSSKAIPPETISFGKFFTLRVSRRSAEATKICIIFKFIRPVKSRCRRDFQGYFRTSSFQYVQGESIFNNVPPISRLWFVWFSITARSTVFSTEKQPSSFCKHTQYLEIDQFVYLLWFVRVREAHQQKACVLGSSTSSYNRWCFKE